MKIIPNKLIPCGHRVLVKLCDFEEKTEGGIILATDASKDAKKRATCEAKVMKLGVNAFKAFDDGKPWCKKGDIVLIAKYSGEDREDPVTKEIYRIINDEDIYATYTG